MVLALSHNLSVHVYAPIIADLCTYCVDKWIKTVEEVIACMTRERRFCQRLGWFHFICVSELHIIA